MEARTASPKSPLRIINGFLLYTSEVILPLGTPPRPNAMSRLMEPVGTVSIFMLALESPSFITDPLP